MKKNITYKKYQAFETVYREIKNESKRINGFDAPKKYHHDPAKLDVFRDFSHYIRWSNELHDTSSKIISELSSIYKKSIKASSSFFQLNTETKINNLLEDFYSYDTSLRNLLNDIFEFQVCMLATHISEKQAEIEALSNQLNHILSLEDKITFTCNRKLYEISSFRISFYALIVSVVAIAVSLISNLLR